MLTMIWIILFLAVSMTLAYHRASLSVWTVALFVFLMLIVSIVQPRVITLGVLTTLYTIVFVVLNIHSLRRRLISNVILRIYCKLMPHLSDTEQVALESGTVGWEGDLLSGMPNWQRFHDLPLAQLTDEEQAFMNGPVEAVCCLVDSWQIACDMKIPETIWSALKSEGFFGMIIPKQYGGKAFSALGHARVILKLASASTAVATIVSVPNSLGPAELLLRYGTEEQKNYYLPRLACGQEIPCFALTSPRAGSDASSITDVGIVCHHRLDGKEQLCLRLNWDKRYITLSPVATLIGLAFKCYDPDHLLGDVADLGITCALVPAHLPGVVTGRLHIPLRCAFPNGPTQGKDVFIPLQSVIGGQKMIGQGWRMLMECLATGRSISLPAIVNGNAKRALLASGAYARIRRQFNTSIAGFEGVQAVLARMAGYTYAIDALCALTLSYLNQGESPAVASAISKYHATELSRKVINDAMDIQGGKGICMGPKNYLAQSYIESPISITVEGANILTRSLMIYSQGAIRCHPYLLSEMKAAIATPNRYRNIAFDRALFAHIGFIMSNTVRSLFLGLCHSGGKPQKLYSSLTPYYQLLTRFSAVLAFISDVMVILMGPKLKRREMLSARLGDILSLLYIISSVLKFYEHKKLKSELPLVTWICDELFYRMQIQLDLLVANIEIRSVRCSLGMLIFPRGKKLKAPSDRLTREVAELITKPGPVRQRFAENIYYTPNINNPVAVMESVLAQVIAVEPIEVKIAHALKKGLVSGVTLEEKVRSAVSARVITEEEAHRLLEADQARMNVIHVDDFCLDKES